MTDIIFEWDDRKAQQNEQKHGISFEAAQTAFYNENAQLGKHHCVSVTSQLAMREVSSNRYQHLPPRPPYTR